MNTNKICATMITLTLTGLTAACSNEPSSGSFTAEARCAPAPSTAKGGATSSNQQQSDGLLGKSQGKTYCDLANELRARAKDSIPAAKPSPAETPSTPTAEGSKASSSPGAAARAVHESGAVYLTDTDKNQLQKALETAEEKCRSGIEFDAQLTEYQKVVNDLNPNSKDSNQQTPTDLSGGLNPACVPDVTQDAVGGLKQAGGGKNAAANVPTGAVPKPDYQPGTGTTHIPTTQTPVNSSLSKPDPTIFGPLQWGTTRDERTKDEPTSSPQSGGSGGCLKTSGSKIGCDD